MYCECDSSDHLIVRREIDRKYMVALKGFSGFPEKCTIPTHPATFCAVSAQAGIVLATNCVRYALSESSSVAGHSRMPPRFSYLFRKKKIIN